MREIHEALDGIDVVLHLIDVNDPDPMPPEVLETLAHINAPVFLVVNKIDAAKPRFNWARFEKVIQAAPPAERFAISALEHTGVEELINAVIARLPVGHAFYDPDQLSDRDMRYLASERVREKIFELTRQEIPYGVATQVEEFREEPGRKPFILVNVFVEHDSQKGILVGQGASMIKRIGQEARQEIEDLMGEPVFLELKVKVRKNWRKNDAALRDLGYSPPKKKRK
jgi:GTPase